MDRDELIRKRTIYDKMVKLGNHIIEAINKNRLDLATIFCDDEINTILHTIKLDIDRSKKDLKDIEKQLEMQYLKEIRLMDGDCKYIM